MDQKSDRVSRDKLFVQNAAHQRLRFCISSSRDQILLGLSRLKLFSTESRLEAAFEFGQFS